LELFLASALKMRHFNGRAVGEQPTENIETACVTVGFNNFPLKTTALSFADPLTNAD
jgi:hypothetical protein